MKKNIGKFFTLGNFFGIIIALAIAIICVLLAIYIIQQMATDCTIYGGCIMNATLAG